MNLPWILNAITRKLELEKLTEEAELLSKISIFIEYGLPNVLAIKIYQAGIRSRVSAVELSSFFIGGENNTISWFRRALMEGDFHNVTESSREWLDLFKESTISKVKIKSNIKNFSLPENSFGTIKSNMLFAKQVNGKQYLHSPDYGEVKEVMNTEDFNFTEISNIEGVRFFYDEHLSIWVMQNENPNIQIKVDL